jgi:macrolide transport system ATP-binding/permease protein
MNGVLQDFRYALRQLRKSPGFAATAIVVLALGMSASVAIFAFVDAALIKPLPYANPDRLVDVTESAEMFPRANLSYPDYLDWKKLNTVFSSMDVYNGTGYLLRAAEGTAPVPGIRVSDGFFGTLGIVPILGRGDSERNSPHECRGAAV